MPRHHDEKRRRRTTTKRGNGPDRWRKPRYAWNLIAVAGIVIAGFVLVSGENDTTPVPRHDGPSAVIVDQLSLTFPNPAFVEQATRTLEEAGYAVDYHPGERVTVDFYRHLPDLGYDILILRTHSTANRADGGEGDIFIFTGEPYNPLQYIVDQFSGRLSIVTEAEPDGQYNQWFGITPEFIHSSQGNLDGAVVFMMGCQGMANHSMAEAFMDKGASAYVGWDDEVGAFHTDMATLVWLRSYLDGASVELATAETMQIMGPDREFGGALEHAYATVQEGLYST